MAAIKYLYNDTLGRPEVVAAFPWPKVKNKLPTILSFNELFALFEAADDNLLKTAFLVAYGAGLRVNEVCHLKTSDIDSERGVIRVLGKGSKEKRYSLHAFFAHYVSIGVKTDLLQTGYFLAVLAMAQ